MKQTIDIYKESLSSSLVNYGLSKEASDRLASDAVTMRKQAYDDDEPGYFENPDGSFNWKNLLVPLGVMLASGFVGYQSGKHGQAGRSALANTKNYLIGTARQLIRRQNAPTFLDPNIERSVQNGTY